MKNSGLFEIVKTFVWALLLASIFRTFAFDPYHIPSGSMLPNLLIGDFVIVSKYSYGYSQYSTWPFPAPFIEGRYLYTEPERGDVAVFRVPENQPGKNIYIKRIVGLPGDKIQVSEGKLSINGELVDSERKDSWAYGTDFYKVFEESLDNGKKYLTLDEGKGYMLDDTKEFIVPEKQFFMMGDNRDNSDDSRASLGFVPKEHLIGRAEIVMFSSQGMIWDITKWRSDRFFIGLRD